MVCHQQADPARSITGEQGERGMRSQPLVKCTAAIASHVPPSLTTLVSHIRGPPALGAAAVRPWQNGSAPVAAKESVRASGSAPRRLP